MSAPPTPSASAVLHRNLHTIPHTVNSAKGHYLYFAPDNRPVLDSTGGAAVSCLGHAHPAVLSAMAAQLPELTYCHSMFFSHPPGERLATFLAESTGGRLPLALLLSSGSEAMESALKLARQYFTEKGEGQRTRFIARNESYHGNTLGALGVGRHRTRRERFEPLLSRQVSWVSACNEYRGRREGESDEGYVERLKKELEEEFVRLGPETVVAFVAEPVVGAAAGCVTAVPGYFRAMREVCDKYGALLILDEIMCGMGRTGTLHAWQQEDVVPDIQTIGKGLGGGYMPIAGVLVGGKIADVLKSGSGKFVNGQTYQGHPLACVAAEAVQKVVIEENLLKNVRVKGNYMYSKLKCTLSEHPHVGNIRGRGLFWGVELVEDRASKKPFASKLRLADAVHEAALVAESSIMLYPGQGCVDGWSGDQIMIAPPYTITEQEIDVIVDGTKKAIDVAISAAQKAMNGQ